MISIQFHSFQKKKDLRHFINKLNERPNDKNIKINLAGDFFTAPEIIAPISGICDFLKENGYKINIRFNGNQLKQSGIINPFTVQNNSYELLSPMYKVWKYNTDEEVSKIVSAYVKYLNTKAECAKGVVEAFEWTVNEVMDNVIQHSQSNFGYVVCTVTHNAHISVAVYDNGIGILKSFKGSPYRFNSPQDAIISAMKEGCTRDRRIGQGNGLWGMSKLVSTNKGALSVTSSEAYISVAMSGETYKGTMVSFKSYKEALPGTIVDFQFLCNNEVSMTEVFGGNYQFANINLESFENDKDQIILKVSDFSFGYATRIAGERARTMAINFVTQSNEKEIILIDFAGIGIISSSFADEFIAKLICHYGFIKFNNLFKLINLQNENVAIINRSVMQRMGTEIKMPA